jgi:endonuclease YncB( thermonuclease family)
MPGVIFVLSLLLLQNSTSSALAPEGQAAIVLRVIDGDTVEVRGAGERIRLANIDTPETGVRAQCAAERAAGDTAAETARALVARAEAIVITRTGRVDRYGRTVGFVVLDGRDLGAAMIDAGLARPWRGRREPWCAADGALPP